MNDIYPSLPLDDISICREDIYNQLCHLDISKSPGPNGWHTRFFKESAEQMVTPLQILFRKFLDSGFIPDQWKTANVIPIFKKGNRKLPSNYRPISLTSVTCKIFESLIRDAVMTYLLTDGLLAKEQWHGFMPRRSCVTQLLTAMEDWTKSLQDGVPIDVVYLDFSKAFDSVPHIRLLVKLQAHGIKGKLLNWIQSFLTNRKQRVIINGSQSDESAVISGVPQGSVLGPLLFLIYVSDIPGAISSSSLLFADDTKLYQPISDYRSFQQLQADIVILGHWSKLWQLNFNTKKSFILHLGKSNPCHAYHIGDDLLQPVKEHKDLAIGVLMDVNLKFHGHVSTVASKANQMLGLIRKSFTNLNSKILPLLYKTLVRPHLEYTNVVWGPIYISDLNIIESVQR